MVAHAILAVLFLTVQSHAQDEIRLLSPNGTCGFTLELVDARPQYTVLFKGDLLVTPSSLHLSFQDGSLFRDGFVLGPPAFDAADDEYQLVVGKARRVRNHYREVTIPLEEGGGQRRQICIVARAYDDGVAFRFVYPKQENWNSYDLCDEQTGFNLAGDPILRTLFLPNHTTSHEGEYTALKLSMVREDTLMDVPTLCEWDDGSYMAITEAALVDYAGMYLVKCDGTLTTRLSPLPGGSGVAVKATMPHQSPWRVLMIGDRIGTLLESNILTNLNAPCAIDDVSWIEPGKTTFSWWNGNITPDTTFAPGNNFATHKYYIDFCAAHSFKYHTVVEYGGQPWYMSDGTVFTSTQNADVTRPVPGLDMERICDYAASKGVGVRVWVRWEALYHQLDSALAQYQEWGIRGMMVDFLDRDDQEMINIQVEILRKAAEHRIHIQFHGVNKPTGLHRTYPNEFTREGTLNYEANKWALRVDPDHDINIPFTRMLAGSTDYHLGGFRAVARADFKVQYTRPLMLGTRCHMLAMYVVLENYLGMVCDFPDAYSGQPGLDFLKHVPTVWDETKVVGGKPGEWLSIARRRGVDWYVGTITNNSARTVTIDLGFLPEGEFIADMYSDEADSAVNPNNLTQRREVVRRGDVLIIAMVGGGGHAIRISNTHVE
jgi:alpha-glucosidase